MADGGQKGRRRRKEARTKRACRVVPIPEMDKAAFLAQVKQKGAGLSRPVIVRGYFDPQAALAISEWQDIESHVTVLPPAQNAALAASYFRRAEKPKMTVREAMERMQGIGNYRPLLTEGERYYVFGGTPLPSATAAAMPWPTAVDNTNGYIASAGVIAKCHFDAWAAYLHVMGRNRFHRCRSIADREKRPRHGSPRRGRFNRWPVPLSSSLPESGASPVIRTSCATRSAPTSVTSRIRSTWCTGRSSSSSAH